MPDTTALATPDWSGAVFCSTRCYACMYGECPEVPHTWGADDDFAHAWATFQDAPGFCGCECGRPKRAVPKVSVRPERVLRAALGSLTLWRWSCPLCNGGGGTSQNAAMTAAARHRASDECRFRRYIR